MADLKNPVKKHSTVKSLEKDLKVSNELQNKKLEALSQDINEKMNKILVGIEHIMIPKKGISSEDAYQHTDGELQDIQTINGEVEAVRDGLASVDSPEFKDKADQMQFDAQLLEIMVQPSMSSYPDHTFTIGVNGLQKLIFRGTRQWLPRCYVEVLLRAKVSSYGNMEVTNPNNNEREIKNPETKAHRYPLQVITDPAGARGGHWLERVTNDMRA
jgi:hypothetical protein